MRHVSRTHRVALDCLFDRIFLDSKIQIRYIDTKKQLADTLTKGNFARDEWNHFFCLLNISHFSSEEYSEVMSKRTQKESGVERVTAKSKPMMNLVARCSERAPAALSSAASESLEKTRKVKLLWVRKLRSTIERGDPLFAYRERGDPLYAHTHQATQNRMLIRLGLLKSGNLMNWWTIRTGTPVVCSQRAHQFVIEDDETNSHTEAEPELSLGSRSFLHRVNDQVRKRQNQSSKDATKDSDKHSVKWWMCMSSTLQASICIHGEELLRQLACHQKYRRSHNETDVRHIWEIDNRTIRRDLWNEYN